MTEHPMVRGLLLPPGVVQPFRLLYRLDDLHIMGVIEGHPKYEAVEAMIQRRPGGGGSIRAILTRHDQSQVDHINDPELLARMGGARRQMVARPIDLELEDLGHARRARLAFASADGEQVVLEVVTAGLPQQRGGGLTDPGGHSADISLPLMLRGASTLAGPASRVWIEGAEYLLPVKVRTAAFVGQEGYYTETHAMGVVRAGEVILTPRTTPSRFEVGAGWRFGTAAGEIAYAITARTPQGELTIAAQDGSGETLTAFGVGDRLDLTRVRVAGDRPDTGGLTLAFDASGGFSLSMDGAPDLVTGRTAVAGSGKAVMLSLVPTEPAWAAARRVDVRCEAQGRELRLITTIGALAPANVAPGAPRR